MKLIPEQFTVKAHPALFKEEGDKNEALLFQSTVDIHFQNTFKTQKKLRRLSLWAFILWGSLKIPTDSRGS